MGALMHLMSTSSKSAELFIQPEDGGTINAE